MMGVLTSQDIAAFSEKRDAYDGEIDRFARAFAEATGETISTAWFFDGWETFNGNIHVKYEDNYQGGVDHHHVSFPLTAFDSDEQRQAAIDAQIAEREAKAQTERERKIRAAQSELERATARLTEAHGYSVQEQADGTHAVFHGQGFVRGGFKERSAALSFARDLADEAEEAGVPAIA